MIGEKVAKFLLSSFITSSNPMAFTLDWRTFLKSAFGEDRNEYDPLMNRDP